MAEGELKALFTNPRESKIDRALIDLNVWVAKRIEEVLISGVFFFDSLGERTKAENPHAHQD
jgi:hypothetical protein